MNKKLMNVRVPIKPVAVALFALVLNGCMVGPHYKAPAIAAPSAYKEAPDSGAGAKALPDKWWELFGDPQLNSFEPQIEVSNQNLKQAQAQFQEARAMVAYYHSGLFPTLSVGASGAGEHTSYNRPPLPGLQGLTYQDYLMQGELSYRG